MLHSEHEKRVHSSASMLSFKQFWIFSIILAISISFQSSAAQIRTFAEAPNNLIASPNAFVPAAVISGTPFEIQLSAPQSAGEWTAWISATVSKGGKLETLNQTLTILNSEYRENRWMISATSPTTAEPAAYSLTVTFTDRGVRRNYAQERSVWLMNQWPQSLVMAHFSDTQTFEQSPDRLVSGLVLAELMSPDIMVITGDVTDAASVLEARRIRGYLATLVSRPVIAVPGNHDRGTTAYDEWVGQRFFHIVVGNFFFVGIDTGTGGVIPRQRLDWLRRTLELGGGRVKILMMHHPLFGRDVEGRLESSSDTLDSSKLYSSWASDPALAKDFLRLIEDYKVELVLAGHIHEDAVLNLVSSRTKTTHWFVTTTTIGAGTNDYRGFRMVNISMNGEVSILHTPPWAKIDKHPNSIPTDKKSQQGFFHANLISGLGSTSVTLDVTNNLPIDLKGTLIVSVQEPSEPGRYRSQVARRDERAQANLLDQKPVGQFTYMAVAVDFPAKTAARITLASSEDSTPPRSVFAYSLPSQPTPGLATTLFFEITDQGWGIMRAYATYEYQGGMHTVEGEKELDFYKFRFPEFPAGTNIKLTVTGEDVAGLKSTVEQTLKIPAGGDTKPAQTPFQVDQQLLFIIASVVGIAVFSVAFLRVKGTRKKDFSPQPLL